MPTAPKLPVYRTVRKEDLASDPDGHDLPPSMKILTPEDIERLGLPPGYLPPGYGYAPSTEMEQGRVDIIVAEGGPYNGEELTCPPGAGEVILVARFGKQQWDLTGKVIYRRTGDKMVFIGPTPQQTDDDDDEE
jgi:hypothetical protein